MSSNEIQQTSEDHSSTKPTTTTKPRSNSSTNTHEITGVEKFAATGGSGGVPHVHGQGYEYLAEHP